MKEISILLFIMLMLLFLKEIKCELDCQITAIKSYYECVDVCRQKYGNQTQTQKLFYNRNTSMCQKLIHCQPPLQKVRYQNRCIDYFFNPYPYQAGNYRTNSDIVHFYMLIVLHGSQDIQTIQQKCFPGYKSSFKVVPSNIQNMPYRYQCDLPQGDDINPSSYGQYYFNQMNQSQKLAILDYHFQNDFNYGNYVLLILIGLIIMAHIIQFLIVGCKKTCRKKSKKKQKIKSKQKRKKSLSIKDKIKINRQKREDKSKQKSKQRKKSLQKQEKKLTMIDKKNIMALQKREDGLNKKTIQTKIKKLQHKNQKKNDIKLLIK